MLLNALSYKVAKVKYCNKVRNGEVERKAISRMKSN